MMEDCRFEIWNWKYNQFTPIEILSKLDSRFVRIHGYSWKIDKETGEKVQDEEYWTTTYINGIRNKDEGSLDILSLFSENTMLKVNGLEVIVEKAEFNKVGNIKLFYKYVQCDETKGQEIRAKNPNWSWINSYNAQLEKINHEYNFIVISPDDKIDFGPFSPSRLEEHRKEWYFEDPVYRPVIVYLEKFFGYTRPDGLTWMEYFWKYTDEKSFGIKIKDQNLVCTDMTDPKKPVQVCSMTEVEEFIEKVVEYAKEKETENSNIQTTE